MEQQLYSRDYDKLYEYILNGGIGLAFCDCKFPGSEKVYRDPCSIRRFDEFYINIGSRGMGFGGVNTWDNRYEETPKTEKELFVEECKRLNIEWAQPIQSSEQGLNLEAEVRNEQ